jgi:hypothetical protein
MDYRFQDGNAQGRTEHVRDVLDHQRHVERLDGLPLLQRY